MRVMVTGGAGYIGSHTVFALLEKGHDVVVIDNFMVGNFDEFPSQVKVKVADLDHVHYVSKVLEDEDIEVVLHLAGAVDVSKSVSDPLFCHEHNVVATLGLLKAMSMARVRKLVFSSSAAVYAPLKDSRRSIDEACERKPVSPYGHSKLFIEEVLAQYSLANPDFSYLCLRYFNVAGVGNGASDNKHVLPRFIKSAIAGDPIEIFGSRFNTSDGTCVRDYVHVEDVADVNTLACERLFSGSYHKLHYNVGSAIPTTVYELVEEIRRVSGRDLKIMYREGRAGDPPGLVSDSGALYRTFGWLFKKGLSDIVRSVYDKEMGL